MCIIVYKPQNEEVTLKTLKTCWEKNSDGGGIMYVEDGKLQIRKTMFFKEFVKLFRDIKEKKNKDIVFHFRIGTSGAMDLRNVHPFYVHDDLAFCHNGILNINVPKKSKISDTKIFNNEILKTLPKNLLEYKGIVDLITEYLDNKNKLCFMDSSGKTTILNEELGIWDRGIWYSNYGYKNYKNYSKTYDYSYYPCDICGTYTKIKQEDFTDIILCEECKKLEVLDCCFCGTALSSSDKAVFDHGDWYCKKCADSLEEHGLIHISKPFNE